MKFTNISIYLIFMVFTIITMQNTTVIGQSQPQGRDYGKIKLKAESITKELTQTLELDEQQQEEIQAILFSSLAKEQALEDHLKMMEKMMQEQVQAAKEETKTNVAALLNDRQKKLWEKDIKKRGEAGE